MLTEKFKDINSIVLELKKITVQDLEDVTNAKHEDFFGRAKKKESLIENFQKAKKKLDKDLEELAKASSGSSILELLDGKQLRLKDEIKANLEALREENKKLVSLVISTTEFYNTLLSQIFQENTNENQEKPGNFLNIKG